MNEDDVGQFALEDASQEELQELQAYLRQQAPLPQEKVGIPELLTKIFKAKDTKKAGSVGNEDLARMRVYLDGMGFFNIIGADLVSSYLASKSEVLSSTSLSHNGVFLNAIITSRRDISLGNKSFKKDKRGLFTRSKPESNEQ